MLSAAARQAAGPLSGTAPAALVGAAQLIRDLGAPVAAAAVDGTRSFTAGAPSRSSSGDLPRAHVFDENDAIVGPQASLVVVSSCIEHQAHAQVSLASPAACGCLLEAAAHACRPASGPPAAPAPLPHRRR